MQNHLLFLNLGGGEIFVILLVVLLFFGSKGIPQVAKGLGRGMREFRDAMNGIEREIRQETDKVKDEVKKIEEEDTK
jgi:sec-independent protein translocase protein TatA